MSRVAIIGSGIAGLGAANMLAGAHDVRMFEAGARPGGHVYTVEVDGHAIDMGFIVHNRERYPLFTALIDELGIATRPTTMAFSVAAGGLEWGSASLSALFAERRRLVDPRHWRFLVAVARLLRTARRDLASERDAISASASERSGGIATASLDDYLAAREVPRDVRDRFVIPLAAALWSLAPDACGAFPAATYFGFLDQHGMLSPVRPLPWRTIVGGSRTYVDALIARLVARGRFELELGARVDGVRRSGGVVAVMANGRELHFDHVVIATHADTALAVLADASPDEAAALGAFRYSRNRTVLHTDRSFLPVRRAAHAAWNYVEDPDTSRVAVTYSMTLLQGLPDAPYLVTLNPRREPRGVRHEVWFEHPQFDRAALAAQRDVARLSGARRVYFAGAYLGFGFHEDGMRSGVAAATKLLAHERMHEASTRELA